MIYMNLGLLWFIANVDTPQPKANVEKLSVLRVDPSILTKT